MAAAYRIVQVKSASASLIGQKVGRLTIVAEAINKHPGRAFLCHCECGNSKVIAKKNLVGSEGNYQTLSCGCLTKERLKKTIKHGHTMNGPSITYKSWNCARNRCLNKNSRSYAAYGGSGITFCDRWQGENGFANFLMDMGERPGKEYSLDRKNCNGNYEPSNCRWATKKEQSNNRRNNFVIEFDGIRLTATEWSDRTGIKMGTIIRRVKDGWSIERTLTERKSDE